MPALPSPAAGEGWGQLSAALGHEQDPGGSPDQVYPHGLWWQYGTLIPTQVPAAAGPQTQIWPSAAV